VDELQTSFSCKSGELRGFRLATAGRMGQGLTTVVMFQALRRKMKARQSFGKRHDSPALNRLMQPKDVL
jgi:hypothetical protein